MTRWFLSSAALALFFFWAFFVFFPCFATGPAYYGRALRRYALFEVLTRQWRCGSKRRDGAGRFRLIRWIGALRAIGRQQPLVNGVVDVIPKQLCVATTEGHIHSVAMIAGRPGVMRNIPGKIDK